VKPLKGLLVLEFSQFMAGPSAGLRLADLGARVIKIERPGSGESGRKIDAKDLYVGNDSLIFHLINRNKQSFTANLKDVEDLKKVKKLIRQADVMTHSFRPGTMKKFGLEYDKVKMLNSEIIYGVITGFGGEGPWASKPGQDLLVQSMSGLTYLTGDRNDPPTTFGLAAADIICGGQLVQGILAALIRRGKTGEGALVELSLIESLLDLQFEVLTTYLNDGGRLPQRSQNGNAHAYLRAPYGVYQTKDGFMVIAMEDLHNLGKVLNFDELSKYNEDEWFSKKDEINGKLASFLKLKTTGHWLSILESADIWCADVYDYRTLLNHEGYKALQMDQQVETKDGRTIKTTRCPIRIDGKRLYSKKEAPKVGEDNRIIEENFNL
jgi:crotonobetainyl-CoA:carnitine CoA-transferase CaiB-like acyl-CoA transferase